jgi:hypothetical protein
MKVIKKTEESFTQKVETIESMMNDFKGTILREENTENSVLK